MKKVYLLVILLLSFKICFAQNSASGVSGDWHINSTWENNVAPNQRLTGNTNTNITVVSTSYVTVRSTSSAGTLDLDGLTLTVNNYLVVEGDLKLGNNAKLVIGSGGKLIVFGNFSSDNKVDITSGGLFVVKGDFSMGGNTTQHGQFENTGGLYLNDPTPRINGEASDEAKSFAQLRVDHLNIYNFITNQSPSPLPVNLLYFKATAQPSAIEINWASSKAWDFSHYELERSADGKAFEYVATIDAEEMTNSVVEYSYADRQPISGTSYYRLKAVDIDGAFEYKNVALVKFGAEIFKVFPNPSNLGYINISWSHATEGATVSLKDNMGRSVRTTKLLADNTTISTEGLTPGMYLLSVQGQAGIQQTQVLVQ